MIKSVFVPKWHTYYYGIKVVYQNSTLQYSKRRVKNLKCQLSSYSRDTVRLLTMINNLKGSQKMGGRLTFLKTFRASLFNDDLENEPNFRRIHVAG